MRLKTVPVCAIVLVASIVGLRAQSPQRAPTAAEAAKAGFTEVAGWLAQSADLIPADKYSYKPVGTVRSVGEMLAHAADGMNWYCGMAVAQTEWSDATEKGKTDKTTVVAALTRSVGACTTVYDNPNARIDRLFGNVAHANLHYGNIITYMRMLGLKPPSS